MVQRPVTKVIPASSRERRRVTVEEVVPWIVTLKHLWDMAQIVLSRPSTLVVADVLET